MAFVDIYSTKRRHGKFRSTIPDIHGLLGNLKGALYTVIPGPPIFSPEGRLYEVEYAIEAVAKAGATVAVLADDGIVVGAEVEDAHPLLDKEAYPGRLFNVDENNACAISGNIADADILIKQMCKISRYHLKTYGEMMPMELLVERTCRKKHGYTMFSRKQPLEISVIYLGWDSYLGYQLYQSDPSGNYNAWRGICTGRNAHRAQHHLNELLSEISLPTLQRALTVTLKALYVAMNGCEMSADTIQLAFLRHHGGATEFHIYNDDQVNMVCCTTVHPSLRQPSPQGDS